MKLSHIALLALTALTLTGCAGKTEMSNDEIIVEATKCDQSGLPWRQVLNKDGSVSKVICTSHQITLKANKVQGPIKWSYEQ